MTEQDDGNTEYEPINWQGVVEQLQKENEEYRVKLTQALKSTPLNEAVDSVIVLVRQTDPMRLYIWVAICCAIIIASARVAEVIIEAIRE